ncbi:MAG: hypothetical protein K6G87_00895 [Butyrivibrio sp.]|nr:hypothetical protein [Butyrivibrio sp.]
MSRQGLPTKKRKTRVFVGKKSRNKAFSGKVFPRKRGKQGFSWEKNQEIRHFQEKASHERGVNKGFRRKKIKK